MSRLAGLFGFFQPIMLSLFRIMVGLVFLQFGLGKLTGFPMAAPNAVFPGQILFSGIMETAGGVLLVLGLFTRPAAFILAGYMAVAVFWIHVPRDILPARNGGNLAVLFCFGFLYLFFAGPGAWALDNRRA